MAAVTCYHSCQVKGPRCSFDQALSRTVQEANEHSFKLLREYLAAARTGGGIGRTAGLPYHFTFYIREELAESQEDTQETEDEESSCAAGELRRVALTLPPPVGVVRPVAAGERPYLGDCMHSVYSDGIFAAPLYFTNLSLLCTTAPAEPYKPEPSGCAALQTKTGPGDSLSPSTRKAFARLLDACGIPAELPPEGHERHYSKLTSLREFLPQVCAANRLAILCLPSCLGKLR